MWSLLSKNLQWKILNDPKLQTMTRTMVSCAECLIKQLEDQTANSKSGEIEIEFSKQFQELTADVISRTAFGSSYKEGKEVFQAQKQLQAISVATLLNLQIPGFK
jgi:PHYB activation tagged suppressor 1